MPITSNDAWDGRLEGFKGRDTAQYIGTVKSTASRCAACRLPFGPGAALSLMVFITERRGQEGLVSSVAFDSALCHLQCQEPGLSVKETLDAVDDVISIGARLVLSGNEAGESDTPVLAYTPVPNVVIGEPRGELRSALVSLMLTHGFQMSLSARYADILQRAVPARDTCTCAVADGAVQFHLDGLLMCSQQLDKNDPADAAWLRAAGAGRVLVISGDNVIFTETSLELDAAARLGTLVTGFVPAS